jgi:hypothetical protein
MNGRINSLTEPNSARFQPLNLDAKIYARNNPLGNVGNSYLYIIAILAGLAYLVMFTFVVVRFAKQKLKKISKFKDNLSEQPLETGKKYRVRKEKTKVLTTTTEASNNDAIVRASDVSNDIDYNKLPEGYDNSEVCTNPNMPLSSENKLNKTKKRYRFQKSLQSTSFFQPTSNNNNNKDTINWNLKDLTKTIVYPLSDNSKYVFVNSNLLEFLENDKIAQKKVKDLCLRGKVIEGNSQGQNGFIIKKEDQKWHGNEDEYDLKMKLCDLDYRLFGKHTKSVTHQKKKCDLFEINGWRESHKDNAITSFPSDIKVKHGL